MENGQIENLTANHSNIDVSDDTKPTTAPGSSTRPVLVPSPIITANPVQKPSRANKHNQHKIISKYHRNRLSIMGWLLFLGASTFAIIIPAMLAGWQYLQFGRVYGQTAAKQHSIYWAVLSMILLGLFIIALVTQLRKSISILKVYTDRIYFRTGFFYSGYCLYNQIRGLSEDCVQEQFLGIKWRFKHTIWIIKSNGKRIKLTSNFDEFDVFVKQLKLQCYPMIAKKLEPRLRDGSWLDFGEISINNATLRTAKLEIPLDTISLLTIDTGKLKILSQHVLDNRKSVTRETQIPTRKILNLEIFFQFTQVGTQL